MISTILVLHPWLTTAALVVLVVAGPLVGAAVASRPRTAYAFAALTLLPAVALTLVPTSRQVPVGCTVEWAVPTLGAVEAMANLELLVAPVMFLAVATRRPLAAAVGGSAVSFLVEAAQGLSLVAGRSCTTNDWLTNSLGAVLGAGLGVLALSVSVRGRRPAPPRPRPLLPGRSASGSRR